MTQTTIAVEPTFETTNLVQQRQYCIPTLENRLQAALEHARRLTAMFELPNPEVAIAWETVDELQAEKARQQAAQKTPFELYCEANPSAPECRIYQV